MDTDALPLSRDPRGRPRLEGAFAEWDCNWSHSGDGLLIALGRGVRLGIDLERVRPRERALDLAQRFFTAPELAWLHAAQRSSIVQSNGLPARATRYSVRSLRLPMPASQLPL